MPSPFSFHLEKELQDPGHCRPLSAGTSKDLEKEKKKKAVTPIPFPHVLNKAKTDGKSDYRKEEAFLRFLKASQIPHCPGTSFGHEGITEDDFPLALLSKVRPGDEGSQE